MSVPCVRLFSDLHFRDARSTLQDLAHLAPLLADADEIVFNGDTVETQIPQVSHHLGTVREFFAQTRAVTFLTGNHDPDISDQAELQLCDGRVWVTHGDLFFDEIAPWSHHRPELRRRLDALAAGHSPARLARIETRLAHNRLACRALPEPAHLFHANFVARTKRMARTLFPPTRVLSMLDSWQTSPRTAAALARAQRPRARVIIYGHTHFPGVWRVPGANGSPVITVINTGSFTRPFGSLFVELKGERVHVRRIARAGGEFRAGRTVADFTLG